MSEAVVEGIFSLGALGGLPDEAHALQLAQATAELRSVAGDRAEHRLPEGPPDHRRELQGSPGGLLQRVEASRDERLEGVRDGTVRAPYLDRRGQLLQE